MDSIEAKLATWSGLYERLKVARARIKEATERPGPVPKELQDEVQELQRKCGVALDDLNAAYARQKAPPG